MSQFKKDCTDGWCSLSLVPMCVPFYERRDLCHKEFKRKCPGHVSKSCLSQKALSTFFWEKTANKTMTSTVLRPFHISGHGSPTPTKCKCFIEVTFVVIKQLSVLCLPLTHTPDPDALNVNRIPPVTYINTPNKHKSTGRLQYLTQTMVCLLNENSVGRTRMSNGKHGWRE